MLAQHLKFKILFFVLLSFLGRLSVARAIDSEYRPLQKHIYDRVESLFTSESNFEKYISENNKTLPISKEPSVLVTVDKDEVNVNEESYTLGTSHIHSFINAPLDHVKAIISEPKNFQMIYNLDKPGTTEIPTEPPEKFRSHIFKSIPVISNQDYIMGYRIKNSKKRWFQRASLVKDNENFALREILQTLTPFEGGVIYQEVAVVYILRWYLRALGPQVRAVTLEEVENVTHAVKCFSEKTYNKGKVITDLTQRKGIAKACWKERLAEVERLQREEQRKKRQKNPA